ncbi:MAG: hypothetical protein KGI84_07735 [Elusimicrobia bacterium]|nr:hypothetical protein [Elusimicrobiota bacterium]
MKIGKISALAMTGLLYLGISNAAAFPSAVNFQGRLTDASGNAVNATESMVFSIWNAATGGSQLWSETQSVAVSSGIYNVALGSVVALSTAVFSSGQTWLQIQVGSDAAMTPRLQFQATPYAFTAQSLESSLPIGDFLSFTPITATISQGSGYTVPAGNNLIIYQLLGTGTCEQYIVGCGGSCNYTAGVSCNVPVSGSQSGTTLSNATSIIGPGDVVSSTSTSISLGMRGVLVPPVVQVVVQDLAAGGSYTVPAGKTFFFEAVAPSPNSSCTGTVAINGISVSSNFNRISGGMALAGQNVNNNTTCTVTLDGYLK